MASFEASEDTPLLRRFSIPPVFTQPGAFEQMNDKAVFEPGHAVPQCKSNLPVAFQLHTISSITRHIPLLQPRPQQRRP